MMNPTFGQGICVNGMTVSAYVNGDLQCACYFMWENSNTTTCTVTHFTATVSSPHKNGKATF